jgi:hypothetical protein
MQAIRINGQPYRLPTTSQDITLSTFIRWTELEENEMPDELRAIVSETDPEKKRLKAGRLPKRTYIRKVVPYYAKVIAAVAGIQEKTLLGDRQHEGAPVMVLDGWYWQIVNALAKFEYEPGRRAFLIDGKPWTLPIEHMAKSTFGEFAEAAQYEDFSADVAGGNWAKMPHVMAVLLRPEGEEFDPYTFDNIVEERAEIMRGLTMDIVYQVSFFLLERNEKLRADSLIYSTARLLATLKRARQN